jgi:hypothetical protein
MTIPRPPWHRFVLSEKLSVRGVPCCEDAHVAGQSAVRRGTLLSVGGVLMQCVDVSHAAHGYTSETGQDEVFIRSAEINDREY